MFNYNRKKYKFLTPAGKRDDSILERPEFMYPEPKGGKRNPEQGNGLVNYLRKPRSEIGTTAFLGAVPALLLTLAAVRMMIVYYGNPPLFVSAMAMSALVLSLFSLVCGGLSFRDRDADHRLAVLGLSIGGIVAAIWIITVIVGAAV